MFYTNRVLFIHVPRTGGTWLTNFARAAFNASVDEHYLKHATLEQIHAAIPQTNHLIPFSIVRSKDEIAESYWNMIAGTRYTTFSTSEWADELDVVRRMSLDEFVSSDRNPANVKYYESGVREFEYEVPLASVARWLIEIHR